MGIVGVHDTGESKVPDFQYQVLSVDEEVGRLQVSVKHIRRVDVFESSQQLVHEQPCMILRQQALLQDFTEVGFHVLLYDIYRVDLRQGAHVLREPPATGPQRFKHLYDVVMIKPANDLDFAQCVFDALRVS